MKIYLHIEVLLRELDNRLLLAVLAASRGHDVILGDISSLTAGASRGTLTGGVFLTKSLTPGEKKIARHGIFRNQSISITSIDEESGLADYLDYAAFTNQRYSAKSLEQASAAFGWGSEDSDALQASFPEHADKVFTTGSPRVDLWRPRFTDYWEKTPSTPVRPFLLVSSNFGGVTGAIPFHETVRKKRRGGYFSRDDKAYSRFLGHRAEQLKLIAAFVEAIEHLSRNTSDFDVVFRPHPTENVETWKVLLDGLPNVHVIREGAITSWVNHSFAVIHNGCTTAFEATIAGTPVIAYTPFPQEYELKAPNDLSTRISNPEKLVEEANKIFQTRQAPASATKNASSLPQALVEKIYIDDEELAAEKIIRVWESLEIVGKDKKTDWSRFRFTLLRKKIFSLPKMLFRKLGLRADDQSHSSQKFPGFDMREVEAKIGRLVVILGISDPIQVTRFSKTVIRVRKKSSSG